MQLRFEEVRNESTQGVTTNTKATSIYLAHAVSAEVKKKSCPERGLRPNRVTLDEVLPPALYRGGVIKRYHCLRALSKMTGIGRELLAKANRKLSYPKKKRLPEKSQELIEKIITFLERSDNS